MSSWISALQRPLVSDGVPGRDRCGKEMKLYWRKIHLRREKLSAGGRSYERHREREGETPRELGRFSLALGMVGQHPHIP